MMMLNDDDFLHELSDICRFFLTFSFQSKLLTNLSQSSSLLHRYIVQLFLFRVFVIQ